MAHRALATPCDVAGPSKLTSVICWMVFPLTSGLREQCVKKQQVMFRCTHDS
jgi:hypothetical protein